VLPPFAAYVGINEAARLTGKGKQQIYRDMKAGRLSWHVAADGKKTLGIADLDRVYGLRRQDVTGNESGHQNRLLPAPVAAVTTETAVELAVLRERCARLEAENSDLRQTRDKLLDQNTRLTMLLPAPPAPAGNGESSSTDAGQADQTGQAQEKIAPEPTGTRRRIWRWPWRRKSETTE
jgi:hypothetical protein